MTSHRPKVSKSEQSLQNATSSGNNHAIYLLPIKDPLLHWHRDVMVIDQGGEGGELETTKPTRHVRVPSGLHSAGRHSSVRRPGELSCEVTNHIADNKVNIAAPRTGNRKWQWQQQQKRSR